MSHSHFDHGFPLGEAAGVSAWEQLLQRGAAALDWCLLAVWACKLLLLQVMIALHTKYTTFAVGCLSYLIVNKRSKLNLLSTNILQVMIKMKQRSCQDACMIVSSLSHSLQADAACTALIA